MDLADFSPHEGEIHGLIGYFGLAHWWLTTFTLAERRHIDESFKPLGLEVGGASSDNHLTRGEISDTSQTAAGLLSALAG